MALRTLTKQTTNFTFQYVDAIQSGAFSVPLLRARTRAEALLQTCESDFAQLQGWFDVPGGFGRGTASRSASNSIPSGITTDTTPTDRCSSRWTRSKCLPI